MKKLVCGAIAGMALIGSALAQSGNDLDEGSRITYDTFNDVFTFSWWGRTGRTYFALQSGDLINWYYFNDLRLGADQPEGIDFQTNADGWFVRLKYTDEPYRDDFDGDGRSNLEELAMGLDPLNAGDSYFDDDGDGLATFTEFLEGRDPQVAEKAGPSFLVTNLEVFTPLEP